MFNQPQMENFPKKYIVADMYYVVGTFFLLLFPKQYNITTIYTVFTLY